MEDKNLRSMLLSPEERQELIRKKALEGIKSLFPIIGTHRVIEAENFSVTPTGMSFKEHTKALAKGGTLYEPVKASIVVKDKQGNVLSKRNGHTLLHLPRLTNHNTFIVNGNEYALKNQLRTKPGVYTRVRGNEELEASFNLAKGSNFRVSMSPEKGSLHLEYGTTKIPAYPIFKALGIQDEDMNKAWGKELVERNRDMFRNSSTTAVNRLYTKIMPESKQVHSSLQDKISAIRDSYEASVLDEETTKSTLGKSFGRVTPEALLTASSKLLRVYKGEEQSDERDSLEFQKVVSPEDIFKERLQLKARELQWKIKNKLDLAQDPTVSKVLPSAIVAPELKKFLSTAQLAALPSQINPVEIMDSALAVTRLGEGGISSDRAVPVSARRLHSSMLGIIDPFRTPESGNVGIDQRFTINSFRDDAGNLYTKLVNAKTKKAEFVAAKDIPKLTIAFPNQDIDKGNVDSMHKGKVSKVKPKEVDYFLDSPSKMYTVNTNLVPIPDSSQGNRIIMGSKMVGQAMPLVHREAPLVQAGIVGDSISMEKLLGMASQVNSVAKKAGTVQSVTEDSITIKNEDGTVNNIEIPVNMPLASKTFLNGVARVKAGDKVKEGDALIDTNFTKDGTLALGKNLKMAYLAYHGLNSNDAVVISKSAAEKMSSINMSKYVIEEDRDTRVDHNKHSAHFPRIFNKDQYSKLDKGIIKPGTILKKGDPIATILGKKTPSIENQMLGKIHSSLRQEFSDRSEIWDGDTDGEVVAVEKEGNRTTVIVKSINPMKVGDKMSNRYGGKGVIAKIIDDQDMIQDSSGKPIDALWSSLGVVSRINPAQVIETAVAKVAEKTGKPIVVEPFAKRDNVKWAKELLKKHNLKDKEDLYDPITGKTIKNIMTGPQYHYKLFKSTETNFSARGLDGGYDINETPSKGGTKGAKGTGLMELNALLGHDARDLLKDNATIAGTRNTEYWRAVQLGLPLPPPKSGFVFDKFKGMLAGAGLRFKREGNLASLAPLTDSEIRKLSNGEIKSGRMVLAKNLKAEQDGLFDNALTGGLSGTKWTHIELPEPIINPIFKDAARRLLNTSEKELDSMLATKGGDTVKGMLNSLNIEKEIEETNSSLKSLKGADKDNAFKRLKALTALKDQQLKPGDAYTFKAFPVLPPKLRPVVPGAKGDLLISDINHLYKDLILAKDKLKEAVDLGLPDSDIAEMRKHLSQATEAVVGTAPPVNAKLAAKDVKGIVNTITGTKYGFFNGRVLAKKLDLTGRGTAAPDPSLGMDEVGLPEDMMWGMYSPFVIKNLVKRGYSAVDAKTAVEKKTAAAREELMVESKNRPVIINRAPTLHKYNMISFFPKPVEGKTIQVNPFMELGMNLDYDGDALQVYVPPSDASNKDAKNMLMSNNLFGDRTKDTLMAYPRMEALTGVYRAAVETTGKTTSQVKKFNTMKDALAAYRRGEVGVADEVEVEND